MYVVRKIIFKCKNLKIKTVIWFLSCAKKMMPSKWEVLIELESLRKPWWPSGAESTLHRHAHKEYFALILFYLHTLFCNIYNIIYELMQKDQALRLLTCVLTVLSHVCWFDLILMVFPNRIFVLIQEPGHVANFHIYYIRASLGGWWWTLVYVRLVRNHCVMVSGLHSSHTLCLCYFITSSEASGLSHSPWNLLKVLLSWDISHDY